MSFRIYTKTGDKGETSLFGGARVPKDHIRIESYGTVDELNSFIGLVRDSIQAEEQRAELKNIQDKLFVLGANLAAQPGKPLSLPPLVEQDILDLEQSIDRMEESLPPLKTFILPGGHTSVSYCHLARCVCRRAERLVVALDHNEPVEDILIQYLNRLSDYLFVLARKIGQDLGAAEIPWTSK
jgi:cob(I)alamin adenosyltransferase